jgi:hypothetical protein
MIIKDGLFSQPQPGQRGHRKITFTVGKRMGKVGIVGVWVRNR